VVTRYLRTGDFTPQRSWDLLDWCRSIGANRFTLGLLEIKGTHASNLDRIAIDLAPYAELTADDGKALGSVRGWTLTDASADVLKSSFVDGLFTRPTYDEAGWPENPTFYRGAAPILTVISHEGEAWLELSEEEVVALKAAGFESYDRGTWV